MKPNQAELKSVSVGVLVPGEMAGLNDRLLNLIAGKPDLYMYYSKTFQYSSVVSNFQKD